MLHRNILLLRANSGLMHPQQRASSLDHFVGALLKQ
jgi:hypothetical protein